MDVQARPVEAPLLRLLSLSLLSPGERQRAAILNLRFCKCCMCPSILLCHTAKNTTNKKGSVYTSEKRSIEACICVYRLMCSFAGSFI